MIKTPLSTMIGGAFWTPSATILGGTSKNTFDQIIQSLFANNEQGFAYDPNDLTTMFQDADGTIPVTAAGQPVGLILDKSGRNNHASQTTSASRPILRQNATTGAYYLEFDGSDDFLRTANIDFAATDKVSLFTGVRKLSVEISMIAELSGASSFYPGTFNISSGLSVGVDRYVSHSRGAAVSSKNQMASTGVYSPPDDAVLSAKHDISNSLSSIRRNGVGGVDGVGDKGSGNFGSYNLYIGRREGVVLPFLGHIYSLIGVGRLTTDSEVVAIEKELAKRSGVTLSV